MSKELATDYMLEQEKFQVHTEDEYFEKALWEEMAMRQNVRDIYEILEQDLPKHLALVDGVTDSK